MITLHMSVVSACIRYPCYDSLRARVGFDLRLLNFGLMRRKRGSIERNLLFRIDEHYAGDGNG
jgi:hypothetical protein